MKTLLHTLACTLALFLPLQTFAVDPPKVLFEEKFADRLDPAWRWLRERPDAWRLANGALVIDTLPGSYWQKQNSSQNTLIRPAPASLKDGFILEVLLENEPKGQYEHAGLLCYLDGENTLVLNKESIDGKGSVFMVAESASKPVVGPQTPYAAREIWVRMIVRETKVIGQIRAGEKEAWQTVGEFPLPRSSKELFVGLHSGYGLEKPERHATFRHFRMLQGSE
jgi:regulation of enolase protein 1 (concanavalin A-like superfamily)